MLCHVDSNGEFDTPMISTTGRQLSRVDVGLVTPNPRTQKWNGRAVVAKTSEEIVAYDAALPHTLDTRAVWHRFTRPEIWRIRAVALTNDDIADLREEMLAGATTNVNDPRFIGGLEALKAIMIPSVWADDAAANVRIAVIRA